jgi:VanZ family protein
MKRNTAAASMPQNRKPWAGVLLVFYVALVAYGSLFPLSNWRMPEDDLLAFLVAPLPRYITRTDIATNILAYLPVGFLMAALLRPSMRLRRAALWAVGFGLVLSFAMETLQMFLPNRFSSNLDILTNGVGALLGAVLYRLAEAWRWPGEHLFAWRARWFMPGRVADLGLVLLGIWVVSQLSLQLPSLVAGNLHAKFVPFWEAVADVSQFSPIRALVYCLEITGLGLFTAVIIKPGHRMVAVLFTMLAAAIVTKFLAAAILIKFSALLRLLSLEALTGLAAGLLLVAYVQTGRSRRPYGPAAGALASFAAAKWVLGMVAGVVGFEWLELPGTMFNVIGLARFFSDIWPILGLAYLVLHWRVSRARVA